MSSAGLDAGGRLAVAQALYKEVGKRINTGDPSNLRGQVDAETLDLWERTGCRSRELRVGGRKVGSVSVRKSEGPVATDPRALDDWLLANGLAREEFSVDLSIVTRNQRDAVLKAARNVCPHAVQRRVIRDPKWADGMAGAGRTVITADGEVVPGCEWGARASTGVYGCKPEDVSAALRELPGVGDVFALLADGS